VIPGYPHARDTIAQEKRAVTGAALFHFSVPRPLVDRLVVSAPEVEKELASLLFVFPHQSALFVITSTGAIEQKKHAAAPNHQRGYGACDHPTYNQARHLDFTSAIPANDHCVESQAKKYHQNNNKKNRALAHAQLLKKRAI
jgi:hypothetical protein